MFVLIELMDYFSNCNSGRGSIAIGVGKCMEYGSAWPKIISIVFDTCKRIAFFLENLELHRALPYRRLKEIFLLLEEIFLLLP